MRSPSIPNLGLWIIGSDAPSAAAEQPPDAPLLAAAAVTLLLVMLTVGTHYVALSLIDHWAPRLMRIRYGGLAIVVYLMLLAHAIEIQIFAMTYYMIDDLQGFGNLVGATDGSYIDYAYFSATVFTTVGFGDIAPVKSLRLIVGSEALTGLMLITWSASFTYLFMQQHRAFHADDRNVNPH